MHGMNNVKLITLPEQHNFKNSFYLTLHYDCLGLYSGLHQELDLHLHRRKC